MSKTISLVQRVYIASPCPVSWDSMAGDERTRYCDHCKLNVYNLSAMTEREAERLIREKEGRLCGAFYRRSDGTILTRDCPIGLRALRRKAFGLAAQVAAVFVVLTGVAAAIVASDSRRRVDPRTTAYGETVKSLHRWMRIDQPPAPALMPGGISFHQQNTDATVVCEPIGPLLEREP